MVKACLEDDVDISDFDLELTQNTDNDSFKEEVAQTSLTKEQTPASEEAELQCQEELLHGT